MTKISIFTKRLLLLSIALLAICVTAVTASAGAEKKTPVIAKEESAAPQGKADKESSTSEPKRRPIETNAAARVNGVAISRSDLDKSYNSRIQEKGMDSQMIINPDRYKEVQLEVLDGLIIRELLWQDAQKKNFIANDEDLQKAMIRAKNSFPSETEFELHLAINRYSENDYAEFLRKQLSVGELVQKDIAQGISITDDEIHTYYVSNSEQFKALEQVHARHILIKVDKGADETAREEAKKQIEGILKEAKGGTDFAELAKKHSQAPSGSKGGDLGFFTRGKMVKPFEEAAFALKAGEISGVIQTIYGYHIIKVEENKEAQIVPEKDVREKIGQFLWDGQVRIAVQKHIDILREKAEIEILLP